MTPPRPSELPELPRGLDLFSSYGAGRLAKHIEDYWRARGYAGIVAERYEIGVGEAWGVRSNIGPNGYPPRIREGAPSTALAA